MQLKDFYASASKHRCRHSRTLMEPNSRGHNTVTFYFDPDRGSTWVWLTTHRADGCSMPVLNGAYDLQNEWVISLFTENARTVWHDLTASGWVEIARGTMGNA